MALQIWRRLTIKGRPARLYRHHEFGKTTFQVKMGVSGMEAIPSPHLPYPTQREAITAAKEQVNPGPSALPSKWTRATVTRKGGQIQIRIGGRR